MRANVCAAVLILTVTLGLPRESAAQPGCETRLAELDALIAEQDELVEQERSSITSIRTMASGMCEQGNDAMANRMIDGALQMLGQRAESAEEAAPSVPKSELTLDYLGGEWCSRGTKNTQEITPYVFAADGSYEIGVPAGDEYGMYPGGDSIERFRNSFDRLIAMAPDRFVTGDRERYEYTFTRESCR